MPALSLLQETKNTLAGLGIRPQKRRGQNFMIDRATLVFISELAALGNPGAVLEIGPGLGFLTRELLLKNLKVTALEKDRVLAGHLSGIFSQTALEILKADVLKIALKKDLGVHEPLQVVANIPYNITSPILEWLILQRSLVSRAILTVQWEVALRLNALPGTKEWGALSIFVQTYAAVRLARKIPRNSFFPAPKVDSAVVELVFSKEPRFDIPDESLFFKTMRRAFQKRRKTALNSLADSEDKIFSKSRLIELFQAAGLDPNRRPETFTIPEWARLVRCIDSL